jgi:VanZ family protein
MNENNKSKIFLILTILMTLTIWINSVLPASISSEQSGFIVGIAQSVFLFLNINLSLDLLSLMIRKYAHFSQFFLLGIFWFQYLYRVLNSKHKVHWYALLLCLLTAIIDESIQLFSEGRAFQFTDILIDLFGSTMAILAFVFTFYLIDKSKGEPL